MLTVSNEHVAIVKYLLSKKVKVNTRDKDGWRALRLANNRTIRHLLKKAGAK
jgi:ankyrin repeat protein